MSNGDEGRRAEPPRTKKFVSPEAEIVWPAIKALDEASKHELLGRLGDHLAVAEDDRTPQGQRIARAVGALREAHRLFEAEGNQGPLTVEVFRRLRVEHPEAGWPPDSSIRRWLGGSWNDALRRARLETCHVLATSQQDRGRLGSCPSEPLPAKEQAMKHREAPTPPQFATPHDTLRRQPAVSFWVARIKAEPDAKPVGLSAEQLAAVYREVRGGRRSDAFEHAYQAHLRDLTLVVRAPDIEDPHEDLQLVFGLPEMQRFWAAWNPTLPARVPGQRRRGPQPRFSTAKAALCVLGMTGESAFLEDAFHALKRRAARDLRDPRSHCRGSCGSVAAGPWGDRPAVGDVVVSVGGAAPAEHRRPVHPAGPIHTVRAAGVSARALLAGRTARADRRL
jgi:hypothetical protein